MRCMHLHIAQVVLASSGQTEYPMKLIMIPVAAALVVPMVTPAAKAASPQDTPLQITLSSADQTDILNQPLLAQAADPTQPMPAPTPTAGGSGFIANWMATANEAQATQPHWMTPLATVTPRLEQEVRYDQYWERAGNGASIDTLDSGKGLELIPTT